MVGLASYFFEVSHSIYISLFYSMNPANSKTTQLLFLPEQKIFQFSTFKFHSKHISESSMQSQPTPVPREGEKLTEMMLWHTKFYNPHQFTAIHLQ